MAIPPGSRERWPLDFITYALSQGYRFRVFTVCDDVTREAPVPVVNNSIGGGFGPGAAIPIRRISGLENANLASTRFAETFVHVHPGQRHRAL